MENYKHITLFDREYPAEVQAEGIAVSEAVAKGHCNNCSFLNVCSTNDRFRPPIFAWCTQRKHEILKEWQVRDGGR